MKDIPKNNFTKVYCSKCDTVFDTQEKFNKHLPNHYTPSCDTCPIDVAISKLVNLFKRNRNSE